MIGGGEGGAEQLSFVELVIRSKSSTSDKGIEQRVIGTSRSILSV